MKRHKNCLRSFVPFRDFIYCNGKRFWNQIKQSASSRNNLAKKKKNYKDVHPHPRGDECSINYVISPETLWENLSLSQMSDLSRRTPFLLLGKYLEQGDVCLTWLSLPDEINTRCHYSYLPKCSEESSQWWWQPWRQQLHCPCGVVSKWLKNKAFQIVSMVINSFYLLLVGSVLGDQCQF